jgi:hypothetical protein
VQPGLDGDDKWHPLRCKAYLNQHRCFLELLLLLLHVTGGQPARAPEIGSIRFRNSIDVPRNIYVIDGRVALVIEVSKTRATRNRNPCVVLSGG